MKHVLFRVAGSWVIVGALLFASAASVAQETKAKPSAQKGNTPSKKTKATSVTAKTASDKGKAPAKKAAKPAKPEASAAAPSPGLTPEMWMLRDVFTFTQPKGWIDYTADTAEWRFRVPDATVKGAAWNQAVLPEGTRVTLQSSGFTVTLSGGKVLKSADLGKGKETHELTDHGALGAGYDYEVAFADASGLNIANRCSTFQNWPFLRMSLVLENKGSAPVQVTEAQLAVFSPGSIRDWSADTQVVRRYVHMRGGRMSYEPKAAPGMVLFCDAARGTELALSLPAENLGEGGIELAQDDGQGSGSVRFRFSPALVLAPGARQVLDSVIVYFGLGDTPRVADYTGWTAKGFSSAGEPRPAPRSWLSAPSGSGLDTLLQQAGAAKDAGIRHALVPSDWEATPGSLRGAEPRYARNPGEMAGALRKAGLAPGIAFDPICVSPKAEAGATENGGVRWANPAVPEGKALITERAAKLRKMGFEFMVSAASAVPDAVLASWGLTRSAADALAVEVVMKACADVPVLAGAQAELPPTRDAWLEAAGAMAFGAHYQVPAAPVRLQTEGEASADLGEALRLFPGVVELYNVPGGALGKAVRAGLARELTPLFPDDVQSVAPKTWRPRGDANTKNGTPVTFK